MDCIAPIVKKNPEFQEGSDLFATFKVPCNRCLACRKRRASQWTFRLQREYEASDSAAFYTFTYTDENLRYPELVEPETGVVFKWMTDGATLHTPDFQKFMKRLRKNQRNHRGKPIKYYACGEYGDKSGRPHYHAIIFNLLGNDRSVEWMEKQWKLGMVHRGDVTEASMRYVTGYVDKKLSDSGDDYGQREVERSLMSKGLGKSYLTPETKKYHKEHLDGFITWKSGQIISMPRYYKDQLFNGEEKAIIADGAARYREEIQEQIEREKQDYHLYDIQQRVEAFRKNHYNSILRRAKTLL